MMLTRTIGMIGIAPVLALAAAAQGSDQNTEALTQRLAELESRDAQNTALIAQMQAELGGLKAQSGGDWLTERRAEEIRSLVQDVLADADTRASLQNTGLTAGWDKGFILCSADDTYRMLLGGAIQTAWFYNNQDEGSSDEHRWGFETRRTSIWLKGHIIDSTWKFLVHGIYSPGSGGSLKLYDAEITKDFGNGWYVRTGQFRQAYGWERLQGYTKTLAVDRSAVTYAFEVGRTSGLEVGYKDDKLYARASVNNGAKNANLAWSNEDVEIALTGRLDYIVEGNWKQFADCTSFKGEEFGLRLGAAGHFQRSEFGTAASGSEIFQWTVDAQAEFGGANVFGALFGKHTDPESGSGDTDMFGFFVQGGVFVSDDVELFGRYEWGDDDTAADDLSLITFGFNKYFAKHNAKFTADFGYGLNEISGSWDKTGIGYREDATDEDGQLIIRTQLQIIF